MANPPVSVPGAVVKERLELRGKRFDYKGTALQVVPLRLSHRQPCHLGYFGLRHRSRWLPHTR